MLSKYRYIATLKDLAYYHRFKHISTAFFKEATPLLASNAPRAVGLIQAIRFIKLKIKTKHSLENSIEFVTQYTQLLKQATKQSNNVRQALSDTLVSIFKLLIESWNFNTNSDPKPNLTYTDWWALLKKVFESTEPKRARKSTKDMMVRILATFLIQPRCFTL
jgi:hypothetical protein